MKFFTYILTFLTFATMAIPLAAQDDDEVDISWVKTRTHKEALITALYMEAKSHVLQKMLDKIPETHTSMDSAFLIGALALGKSENPLAKEDFDKLENNDWNVKSIFSRTPFTQINTIEVPVNIDLSDGFSVTTTSYDKMYGKDTVKKITEEVKNKFKK